jgi:hypothetical protein
VGRTHVCPTCWARLPEHLRQAIASARRKTRASSVALHNELAPVFLRVPGRGFLVAEPLAKTGASDRFQIYGEVGLRYGNERSHGKITNLTTTP